ncbi:short-chain dehydrogenase/reductase [Rhizoctonia solani AG-3 Rhs1AP]|uniref:Short-chain dehydrogenase/reductase n=1 Tax=Rhizoctonia solani AG-3 Rhs1AP TaxID=1086054 RepID=X8JRB9_9AGAM|nr:short-chain dehydrogenase/reductase [Rhizoctonia solani AG-3 Rhs1AP]
MSGARYLIVGANRGIGLEFVKQLLRKPQNIVVGTYRNSSTIDELEKLSEFPSNKGRLSLVELDMNNEQSCKDAANAARVKIGAIDILVVNAGVSGGNALLTEEISNVSRLFDNNVLGPLRICQAFTPLLQDRSTAQDLLPKLVLLSSESGSLTVSKHGRGPAYAISKAGLNMMGRKLAHELESSGIAVGLLHPGWVQTDMGGPNAIVTPEDSVRGMLRVIENLNMGNSGGFWDHEGKQHPW